MPKTRTLVSVNIEGNNVAAGEEVTLSDDDYARLRSQGAVEATEKEAKAAQVEANPEGTYAARTGREDVASTKTEQPKAEAPKQQEEPPKKK